MSWEGGGGRGLFDGVLGWGGVKSQRPTPASAPEMAPTYLVLVDSFLDGGHLGWSAHADAGRLGLTAHALLRYNRCNFSAH